MIDPLSHHAALRIDATGSERVHETLAEETALALLFNGVPHVVMMCTPADLEDFACGFALGEGIIATADELRVVELLPRDQGLALHLAIPAARFEALQARRRNLLAASGCGLCGAETLDAAIRPVPRVAAEDAAPDPLQLAAWFGRLAQAQVLNARCGALHAAAAITADGLVLREDVGRHNALDKVIGALARQARRAQALLLTSRASYELLHKAAVAGIGTVAAVSAPTAHAVRVADAAGIRLYGFAREGRITRYTQV